MTFLYKMFTDTHKALINKITYTEDEDRRYGLTRRQWRKISRIGGECDLLILQIATNPHNLQMCDLIPFFQSINSTDLTKTKKKNS